MRLVMDDEMIRNYKDTLWISVTRMPNFPWALMDNAVHIWNTFYSELRSIEFGDEYES